MITAHVHFRGEPIAISTTLGYIVLATKTAFPTIEEAKTHIAKYLKLKKRNRK